MGDPTEFDTEYVDAQAMGETAERRTFTEEAVERERTIVGRALIGEVEAAEGQAAVERLALVALSALAALPAGRSSAGLVKVSDVVEALRAAAEREDADGRELEATAYEAAAREVKARFGVEAPPSTKEERPAEAWEPVEAADLKVGDKIRAYVIASNEGWEWVRATVLATAPTLSIRWSDGEVRTYRERHPSLERLSPGAHGTKEERHG